MKSIIDKMRIVLVGTTHPGNIGAVARAMKTMSQRNLCLVNPKIYPSAEATARAAGADDILANSRIFSNLKDAIADCDLVIGTSARRRSIPWPVTSPYECAKKIFEGNYTSVAVIFGRESSGLSNDELEHCNLALQIPTNPEYNSLNLAAAVQIICYEIYRLSISDNNIELIENNSPLVCHDKMELLYRHLEECMDETEFYDVNNPGQLIHRMRRLFNRAQLEESEWKILRGFLSKIQEMKAKN